jgi:hypothetical protein
MLGTKKHRDWFFANKYFIDTYIGDDKYPQYKDHIIVKYDYHPSKRFLDFDRKIITLKGIHAEYEDRNRAALYVFKVPEEFYTDYVKFLQGRYAEFSITHKLRVLKFWHLEYADFHPLVKVLFDGVPWAKPLVEKETHKH